MMRKLQQQSKSAQPVPVWLAALFAAECLATDGNVRRAVPWDCVSGRAMYTNDGAAVELIEPGRNGFVAQTPDADALAEGGSD